MVAFSETARVWLSLMPVFMTDGTGTPGLRWGAPRFSAFSCGRVSNHGGAPETSAGPTGS